MNVRQGSKPGVGEMVQIPAGNFMMGSDRYGRDERPVHQVAIATFHMDVTEVTVEAYSECVNEGACSQPGSGSFCNFNNIEQRRRHPINCVTWIQAEMYCRWAGKRLPTEEEWEYAARGSDGRVFAWGNQNPLNQLCWRRLKEKGLGSTCEVGAFPAGSSPFGVMDLAGGVWEWTSSGYSRDYESERDHSRRVLRGGGWGSDKPATVRASMRSWYEPSVQQAFLGFRCCL